VITKMSTRKVAKICIVVDDVEEAAKHYAEILGIPVPEVTTYQEAGPAPSGEAVLRGKPIRYYCRIAMIPLEPVPLELLEPSKDTPSPWGEFLAKHGPGVHFFSFLVDGFEDHADLAKRCGVPVYYTHEMGKKRYAYTDSIPKLGVSFELKEMGEKKKK
jgi:catechol 2,3-dioxygenase-like lactoylglutathione lyase family enzyme